MSILGTPSWEHPIAAFGLLGSQGKLVRSVPTGEESARTREGGPSDWLHSARDKALDSGRTTAMPGLICRTDFHHRPPLKKQTTTFLLEGGFVHKPTFGGRVLTVRGQLPWQLSRRRPTTWQMDDRVAANARKAVQCPQKSRPAGGCPCLFCFFPGTHVPCCNLPVECLFLHVGMLDVAASLLHLHRLKNRPHHVQFCFHTQPNYQDVYPASLSPFQATTTTSLTTSASAKASALYHSNYWYMATTATEPRSQL